MTSATQTKPSRADRRREGGDWDRLTRQPTPTERFSSADVTGLPEPVARWLRHSVPDGTPLYTGVELEMRGEIRLGSWRRFTAAGRCPDALVGARRPAVPQQERAGHHQQCRGPARR
ncbi:MAG: hypothetical protein M3P23_03500 [Actinomycetota bacterium]|nr:hypothetical protein [Actinomycetota bacterium]